MHLDIRLYTHIFAYIYVYTRLYMVDCRNSLLALSMYNYFFNLAMRSFGHSYRTIIIITCLIYSAQAVLQHDMRSFIFLQIAHIMQVAVKTNN